MQIENVGANQVKVFGKDYTVFFSYNTPVAAFEKVTGKYFKTDHTYSRTTSKHINSFLAGIDKARIETRPASWFEALS